MAMIVADRLVKRYGPTLAVDDLSFTVPPGQVTGFLGPNGAGKSTTMRMILGLDAPTSGSATVNGQPYVSFRRPLRQVGALLDATALHGGRTAFNHLRALAWSNGIGTARVREVLDQVGLTSVAGQRAGGFSLGMAQRLGIAAALLGDPPVLMFDEPVNGLDPEGVRWFRLLVKSLAAQGRTILLSSHLMTEMAITADRLIILGRGRLIADTTIADLLASGPGVFVQLRTPEPDSAAALLTARDAIVTQLPDGALKVTGLGREAVGQLAAANGITVLELSSHQTSLEQRYLELTSDVVDYQTVAAPSITAPAAN